MKFLALNIKDIDGKSAGYDFLAGGELEAEETIARLEDALFGNDALFSGVVELKVVFADKEYAVRRDFEKNAVEVFCEGAALDEDRARASLSAIAALGRKQWKENSAPCNAEAFVTDTSSYVEKFLSAMGFDSEELDKRSEACAKEYALAIAQVEALDELISGENLPLLAEDKRRETEALRAELDSMRDDAGRHLENENKKSRLAELEEELAREKASEDSYAASAEKLAEDERLSEKAKVLYRIHELRKENEALRGDLDGVTGELEFAEKAIASEEASLKEKEDNFAHYDERVKALREEFDRMLSENAEKGEITAAALEKIASDEREKALASFNEWNEKYVSVAASLTSSRLDYKKRRSIREGVAFETTLNDKKDRLNTVESVISSQNELIGRLEKEIADSRALLDGSGGAKLSDADARRMRLFKSKILCSTLTVDIAAAEQKIRANEDAKKTYAEDIDALTKAKTALTEYISRCEDRKNKISDKLIGIKARLSFCKDVDSMEYGSVCPVCKGRVTDKAELAQENARLSASYAKYSEELETNRSILAEYHQKLEKIDIRLGQLRERDRLCSVYIDSLAGSVSAKQTALGGLLKEAGASSVPVLERMSDEADAAFSRESGAEASDGAFLHEHIRYLAEQAEELTARIAPLKEEAENLKREIEDMSGAYEEAIAPELDGREAYDYLEEIVAEEKSEDELFAELNDAYERRETYLAFLLNGDADKAPELVTAAAEIFTEVTAEIRRNEDLRQKAWEDRAEVSRILEQKKAVFDEKRAKAEDILSRAELNKSLISELLNTAELNDDDEIPATLSDEERTVLIDEIEDYRRRTETLSLKIEALKSEITDDGFDEEKYERIRDAVKCAEEELITLHERQAVYSAAENLARQKAEKCEKLSESAALLKKLSDGEIAEAVLPVLNDALALEGEGAIASPDGNGIKFTVEDRKGVRTVNTEGLKDGALDLAVNCALNFVLRLATGRDTVRFERAGRRAESRAAEKYGVILL